VNDLVAAAGLEVARGVSLDEGFLHGLYRRPNTSVRRAVGKVIGLFDSRERVIYLDRTVYSMKQRFVALHETGHGVLPWQRDIYAFMEDSQVSLDPEVKEAFDREANVFASEVLFQGGGFEREAADREFGLRVPLALAKKYGSSVYAAVRRYVRTHERVCALLVLEPPVLAGADGFRAKRRRVEVSLAFRERFGEIAWPEYFTPGDAIGACVPVGGVRMTEAGTCSLKGVDGDDCECLVEAFDTTHQVFVLICPASGDRP
jgi:hypothetical protein